MPKRMLTQKNRSRLSLSREIPLRNSTESWKDVPDKCGGLPSRNGDTDIGTFTYFIPHGAFGIGVTCPAPPIFSLFSFYPNCRQAPKGQMHIPNVPYFPHHAALLWAQVTCLIHCLIHPHWCPWCIGQRKWPMNKWEGTLKKTDRQGMNKSPRTDGIQPNVFKRVRGPWNHWQECSIFC